MLGKRGDGRHLPVFRNYDQRFLELIVPVSYAAIVILSGLASALVFLPIRELHNQMQSFKQRHDVQFTKALSDELELARLWGG